MKSNSATEWVRGTEYVAILESALILSDSDVSFAWASRHSHGLLFLTAAKLMRPSNSHAGWIQRVGVRSDPPKMHAVKSPRAGLRRRASMVCLQISHRGQVEI